MPKTARSAGSVLGAAMTASPTAQRTARTVPAARPGIGDRLAGLVLDPTATSAGDGAAASVRTTRSEPRHPIGSGIAFERVENVYRMDPRKIVLEGPYVRHFVEDASFQQLRAAVAVERDIGQHLGIRVLGPPTSQRRILVYGLRRWKAALAEGLERVPVRDYGAIGEERAVELQMLENEIRADPHPVDTAYGFYLLTCQSDWSQKRIARAFEKNKGYVSEMVRVGEAIAQLDENTRGRLYSASGVTVRAFQSVAQIKDVSARSAALVGLIDAVSPVGREPATRTAALREGQAQADRRAAVDHAVFHARTLRHGRSFRIRWTDDDLRHGGARLAEEFKERFLEEYTHLLRRLSVLVANGEGQGSVEGASAEIAAVVAQAARDAARVDGRFGPRSTSAVQPFVQPVVQPVVQPATREQGRPRAKGQ